MLGRRLQLEQIDDIDEPNLQIHEFFAQKGGSRESFLGGYISGGCDDYVWLPSLVITGPIPDSDPFRAMRDRRVHIQILQVLLFVADDHVHIVLTSQAVIGNRQQAVHVGWQIDARDIRTFIYDNVEKSRILVGKAIMVLAPDRRGNQQVQRSNGITPREVIADLQ